MSGQIENTHRTETHRTETREAPLSGVVPLHVVYELNDLLAQAGIALRQPPRRHYAWCVADVSEARRPKAPGEVPTRIGRVVAFIDDHLEGPLSLDLLADEAALSKYHFSRLFRDEVGQTPWAYVRDARIQKAKTLLEQGASPAAAAIEAGFFDQSHLTNVMKDVEGITPKQYQRERCQVDRKDLQE